MKKYLHSLRSFSSSFSFCALAVLLSSFFLGASAQAQGERVVLAANTKITITPRGLPAEDKEAIKGEYDILGNGTIRGLYLLPNDGAFVAAGKTPAQLAREIEQAYVKNGFYTRIRLTVEARQAVEGPSTFTISGEINKPGAYPRTPGITLVKALAVAGGRSTFAGHTVVITRGDQRMKLSLKKQADRNFIILANDYLEVYEDRLIGKDGPSTR